MESILSYELQAETAMQQYQAVSSSASNEMNCRLSMWPDEDVMSNVLGITKTNAFNGQMVEIVLEGILFDLKWNWIPNKPIFVGGGGYLTQTMPTKSVYQIAKAIGPHTIFVAPSMFLLLNP